MFACHDGLSREYEVSCPELDFIVDIARSTSGVLGARMMGGGFGGCVIGIVEQDRRDAYIGEVADKFEHRFGMQPRVIDVVIGDGAHKIE